MFRFAHPDLLYLLIVIPLLVIFYIVTVRHKKKAIAEFGNPDLLNGLMPLLSFKRGALKFVLILIALLFIILGVAGPQFGSKLQQVKKEGVELIIALDVSNSMLAQDIKPDRLEAAKQAISRMVEKLNNDKIGLIVFAGDAYVQLPITTDYSSAKLFLSGISTDIVPIQGTAIGNAIDLASKSFTPNTEASKAIIVITDGENHQDDAVAAAKAAREKGIYVHTIGMGLPQGGPIPEKGNPGQFMKDGSGNVVISKLDEETLRAIAKAGEGMFVRASNSNVGLTTLLDEINRMDKTLLEERVYSDYSEKYQYFILIGLLFVLLEFIVLGRKNKNLLKINIFGNEENVKN
ncbi:MULTISPECIES: VWA domain-containing protein [Sanguibacteroides]|uniref:Membrane protein n=1 Tax=Sanguibacteroides justesenii TaxID=1547597 RepID=A0A0C3R9M6_9PORP|nr:MULTISPECIES: VWA domain-containing protein [Sanguibacteroides]KIO42664.1 membrane protein [Sanguibacteroides justesenii]KIO47380.1 membrane protein [Sanguibacteroides justesenii]PXZ42674.1 VWA domain-containing protein [Sanguibacteroides justesenii]